jgi:hypothetical protein
MNKEQYKRYLKLPQERKARFISIAKAEKMDKNSIYWLELGYAVHNPKVRKAMFDSISR